MRNVPLKDRQKVLPQETIEKFVQTPSPSKAEVLRLEEEKRRRK